MQREERQMHRVIVLVCSAVIRSVGGLERALVQMRGNANAEAVIHGVECTPPALLRIEEGLSQDKRRAARALRSRANRAVCTNGDRRHLAFEEFRTQAVWRRR